MVSKTLEERRLQAAFTLRIVEMVNRMRMQPLPRTTGLPWGLSVATGIIITVLTLSPRVDIPEIIFDPTDSTILSKTELAEAGEIPVDVLRVSPVPFTPGGRGYGDGRGSDLPSHHNALLLAPSGEGDVFPEKPAGRLGKGPIIDIAYSPAGRHIAVAGGTGVWLYNADDLTEAGVLTVTGP